MRMKEQLDSKQKEPPKGLKGIKLSLSFAEVEAATIGKRDEGCDGQVITSTGRQKE